MCCNFCWLHFSVSIISSTLHEADWFTCIHFTSLLWPLTLFVSHFTSLIFYRLSPDLSVLSKAFQLISYKILYFDNKMNVLSITLGSWVSGIDCEEDDIAAYLLNKSTAVKTLLRWKLKRRKNCSTLYQYSLLLSSFISYLCPHYHSLL